jgi:antitoxin component YwqK of YwqJK toxin-antitoxin module
MYLSAVIVIFFMGLIHSTLCSADIEKEDELLMKMIEESFKGEWYPLSNKTLPYKGFKVKNGLLFRDNPDIHPFTGWYSQFDTNKQVRLLNSFMEGKRQGVSAEWDELGNLRKKEEYFDGEKDGTHIEINAMGIKVSERNYLIGKLHGESTFWYENGQRKLVSVFEYGLIMEAKGWLSNGEPCPYTKVKDGKGVIFNFGDGFLEQLLQSPKPESRLNRESIESDIFNLEELRVDR